MTLVKFNKLQGDVPDGLSHGSHHKIIWVCDCGKQVVRPYKEVYNGRSKTCGRCNWICIDQDHKFNNLRIKTSIEIAPCSNKLVDWVCDCGRETSAAIQKVLKGQIKSCGGCNKIPAEQIIIQKFGKLRIKVPEPISSGSHRKVTWICDCGREKLIDIHSVTSGLSKSCGRCNELSSKEMAVKKFGHLKLKTPINIKPGSGKKVTWICDCGNETTAMIAHVISGHTESCGRCLLSMQKHFNNARHNIRNLRTPILPVQLPDWTPIALETITNVNKPFRARCRLCGREYYPRWYSIRLGHSLTCGCTTSRVSTGQQEIFEYIVGLGIEAKLEFPINKMKYDIYVPTKNITIEYAGLRWHSYATSRYRDLAKWQNSVSSGMRHLMIYEDEWTHAKSKVQNLLRFILKSCPVRLRPSQCKIKVIQSDAANQIYKEFHYIGPCRARIHYGVYYDKQLIACCSFTKPTRQSKYDWELVRMVSNPDYLIHGIWSKIIKLFVNEVKPELIVSFSDNRLYTGEVYQKLGFVFDGDVKPDYYWWKNKRRYHKSTLRKPSGETRTEDELRRVHGYSKIWDLGKKRWVYHSVTLTGSVSC